MHSRFDPFRAAAAFILLVGVLSNVGAQTASDLFAQAGQAFAESDFRSALEDFEAARESGMSGPALEYNIAVCRYRLGQWAEAEADFASLAVRHSSMRPLATYNRGLALLQLGHDADARAAFESAREGADARLIGLVDAALARLDSVTPRQAGAPAWLKYLDLALGNDDNVALVDDASLAQPAGGSLFTELYGQLGGPMIRSGRWRLDASVYAARYSSAGEYDQTVLRLGALHRWRFGSWRLDAGPYLSRSRLDGDAFERRVSGALSGRRVLDAASSLTFEFRHEEIDAGAARFAFVGGDRDLLRARYERETGAGRWRADLDHERNDRAAAGVSPTRLRAALAFRRPLSPLWFGEVRYAHRTSRYDDLAVPRDEKLDTLAFYAGRDLGAGWQWLTQIELSRNDSDDARFDYRRHRVTLSFGRLF